jgi:hypothetical protein
MGTVISNLKARFGVDTSDFKKGLKDGEKAVADFKGVAGGVLDDFASMFGVNMSAVNGALGTANKSLSFLGSAFTGAAKGGNLLAIGLKVLKVALISTGIGAIIVVLGSLIAYFQKTGEGSDKFAKILAQVKSVLNNVIERFAVFGKGLYEIMTGKFKQGWETMRDAFKGIGDEIKEDWKAAGDLADREDALEDKEIALINSLEARRAKVAELRLLAKEELEDNKKKVDLITQAEGLIKSVYGDEIGLEKERLAIMKAKLAIQTSDPTDDQRREVAEQEAKINRLLREQSTELKGLLREKNAALQIVNEEVALEKKKAETVAITNAAINNLQMPDFNQVISDALAPLPKIKETINNVMVDVTDTVNSALEGIAVGFGEFIGSLATGDAGLKEFGKMIGQVFADMAINVGKIAIATGFTVLGIKKALESMDPYVAIVAGIALVALGTAVKGALANVASGSGASSSSLGSSGYYDTRGHGTMATQKVQIGGKVELVASGSALKGTLDLENNRVATNT